MKFYIQEEVMNMRQRLAFNGAGTDQQILASCAQRESNSQSP